MTRHRGDGEVAFSAKVEVVEQETYADSAFGGSQNPLAESATAAVSLPDVVLHVDAVLGGVCQDDARQEGVFAGIEEAESRTPRVAGERVREKEAAARAEIDE